MDSNLGMKEEEEKYEVTFYFTSGENMSIEVGLEKLKEIYSIIDNMWGDRFDHFCADKYWGINFSFITHYKVKELF